MQHLPTSTLLQGGKYKIERVLGQGGFGITYLATQVGLNRKVAVKEFFMREYCNRDVDTSHVTVGSDGSKETVEKFRHKFVKEAQNIACLKHPHIISIYDVFEENGTAYYVMEYLDRGSLADLVKQRGRLSEADALRYIRQIADALRYIHARNMNHLDVKPGNILIDETDNAVLIDFGLSKRYDDEGNQTSTTPVGISHGYAPLEQYRKGGVGTFSPATDIYSLGATLYKLVTGSTPPDANDILADRLAPLNTVSASVFNAIEQAMHPNRNKRPQSVDTFMPLFNVPISEDEERTELIVKKDRANNEYDGENLEEEKDSSSFSFISLKKLLIPLLVCVVVVVFFGVRAYNEQRATEEAERKQVEAAKRKEEIRVSMLPTGTLNGHEYVDLGLSVKWATCNIGASSPSEYGNYYAWGETSTKSEYTRSNGKTWNKSIGSIAGNASYDAARANWGGTWRLPTKAEFQELIDKCTWTWIFQGGHNGYKVTSENGKSIFLPATGSIDLSLSGAGMLGYYWSGTSKSSIEIVDGIEFRDQGAYKLFINRDSRDVALYAKPYDGNSVRPVTD